MDFRFFELFELCLYRGITSKYVKNIKEARKFAGFLHKLLIYLAMQRI